MAVSSVANPAVPPTAPQQQQQPKREPQPVSRAVYAGSASNQLSHLRTHLEFQRQNRYEKAQIDWATTISRADSYRHITRHLHAKINCKNPSPEPPGRLTDPEAQRQLERLAQLVRCRQTPSPGDLHHLNWKLKVRAVQAARPHLSRAAAADKITRYRHDSLRPRETNFPLDIQVSHIRQRQLQELLRHQGASPKRANRSRIAEFYPCIDCHSMVRKETADRLGACPVCVKGNPFAQEPIEIAVARDPQQTPVGKPAFPPNYFLRPQEPLN